MIDPQFTQGSHSYSALRILQPKKYSLFDAVSKRRKNAQELGDGVRFFLPGIQRGHRTLPLIVTFDGFLSHRGTPIVIIQLSNDGIFHETSKINQPFDHPAIEVPHFFGPSH